MAEQIRITWFEDSPDAGLPECVCSLCGTVIGEPGVEEGEVPVRLFDMDRDREARFHPGCYQQVSWAEAGRVEMEMVRRDLRTRRLAGEENG